MWNRRRILARVTSIVYSTLEILVVIIIAISRLGVSIATTSYQKSTLTWPSWSSMCNVLYALPWPFSRVLQH
jgi:hypothetical protein